MGPHTVEEKVVEFSVKWLRLCELPFQIANQVWWLGEISCFVDGGENRFGCEGYTAWMWV